MFNLLARPSAGISVVEVQKLEVFCDFCGARATLCRNRRGGGAKTRGFCDFCCSNWSSGVVSWFARLLPEPAGCGFDSSLVRGRASQDATCVLKQLAQSNLRRPTCTDQFAESALPRATCAEQLTQSNLHRATCTEQLAQSNLQGAQFAQSNLQGATCRDQLAGATCAEQLAQSNLHSATCVEQLAQTNLHRPVCAEHLAWCCLALASRMLRAGKKNASCSVGPTSLAMFCFRANRGLVVLFACSRVLLTCLLAIFGVALFACVLACFLVLLCLFGGLFACFCVCVFVFLSLCVFVCFCVCCLCVWGMFFQSTTKRSRGGFENWSGGWPNRVASPSRVSGKMKLHFQRGS